MRPRSTLIALLLALGFGFAAVSPAQDFPAPTNLGDPARLGLGIQRTMTLLETSTPERRNTVTILLYGQSITAGPWGVELEKHLRETYPHANLVYLRRPLSGFSTERLVKTAEFDLYPVYPDLVIFHDYGNNEDYERMIRKLREQTTAEVIVQADHLRRSESPIDEARPETIEDPRQRHAADRNLRFLPEIARRYGGGFDNRRELWKDYLREHNLAPGDLVKDDVHPNDHGTFLMTELIKAYLVRREETRIDPMNCGYVTTLVAGEDFDVDQDAIEIRFEGNRVDVVFDAEAEGGCQATLDGRPPLDDPAMRYHARNRVRWRDTPIPPGPWPPALRVGFQTPLLPETWTLRAVQDPNRPESYTFTLQGSVTGNDGAGRTDERFVSDSGRVVIEAEDWDVRFAITTLRRLDSLPKAFEIDWPVESQAVNEVIPPATPAGVERCVTVAQRFETGDHTLRLTGNVRGVRAIRIYNPQRFPGP